MTDHVRFVGLSGNLEIDALVAGSAWDTTLGSKIITVNFPTSAGYYAASYPYNLDDTFSAVSEVFISRFQSALSQYEMVAQISFEIVDAGASSDISVAKSLNVGSIGPNGYGFSPQGGGDVWFNPDPLRLGDEAPLGSGSFRLMMHELGHAMGLKHPFSGSTTLPLDLDVNEFTIMSYNRFPGGGLSPAKGHDPQSLMQLDIQAVQYLYGANFAYNSGDTRYSFDPATGQMLTNGIGGDTPPKNVIYRTIWDGGGIDTYDLSNYSTSMILDLRPGAGSLVSLSQLAIVDTPSDRRASANLFNALLYQDDLRSLIENAIGGSAGDVITGNQASNRLDGRAGNDILSGGAGADRLIGGAGFDRLDGGTGADILTGGADGDTFVFSSLTQSGLTRAQMDRISDFDTRGDLIRVSQIDAVQGGADQAFTYIGKLAFTAAGQIRAVQAGADTIVQLNTDGDQNAEMSFILSGFRAIHLSGSDFIL